jgi:hypothetical protein
MFLSRFIWIQSDHCPQQTRLGVSGGSVGGSVYGNASLTSPLGGSGGGGGSVPSNSTSIGAGGGGSGGTIYIRSSNLTIVGNVSAVGGQGTNG